MHRDVDFGDGALGTVSLREPVLRYVGNPILTSHQVNDVWRDPAPQVVTAHNAGVAVVNGHTVLLFPGQDPLTGQLHRQPRHNYIAP